MATRRWAWRSTLHQAPLGTYLGWNVTARGFARAECGLNGVFRSVREDEARNAWRPAIPRPSSRRAIWFARRVRHSGAGGCGAAGALERFLLQEDPDRLIAEAGASDVLK